MNNLFLKIFGFLTNLIDYSNKKKILDYLKNKLRNKSLNIIDIGAHKGETINFFLNNFSINQIFAFEPNKELFYQLKDNSKYSGKNINIYNLGVGQIDEVKYLNIMTDSSSSTFHTINKNTNYFKKKKKYYQFFLKIKIS